MRATCDLEVDVLRILFRDTPIEENDEDKPGVILDYDKDATSLEWKCGMIRSKWRIRAAWIMP